MSSSPKSSSSSYKTANSSSSSYKSAKSAKSSSPKSSNKTKKAATMIQRRQRSNKTRKRIKSEAAKKIQSSYRSLFKCPVCYELKKNNEKFDLDCGNKHFVCKTCADNLKGPSAICPMCRQPVPKLRGEKVIDGESLRFIDRFFNRQNPYSLYTEINKGRLIEFITRIIQEPINANIFHLVRLYLGLLSNYMSYYKGPNSLLSVFFTKDGSKYKIRRRGTATFNGFRRTFIILVKLKNYLRDKMEIVIPSEYLKNITDVLLLYRINDTKTKKTLNIDDEIRYFNNDYLNRIYSR